MAGQDHGDDGIDEALAGVMHLALTAAGRLGEQVARQRETRLREAQASSEQAGRELQNRFTAEREAARAALAPVHHDQWWDTAEPGEIERVYETARAWADLDPEAVRAEDAITTQVKDRYGIDMTGEVGDAQGVAKETAAEDRPGRIERLARLAPRAEERGGAALLHRADDIDRAAKMAADVTARLSGGLEREGEVAAYDTPARRKTMSANLRSSVGNGNETAIAARVRADHSQAAPATEATNDIAAESLSARRAGAGHQRGRSAAATVDVGRTTAE